MSDNRYDDAILMAVSTCSGLAIGFWFGYLVGLRLA